MNNLTLLVMAAGMGSRYGGLKQLDPVGPNGETIIDYSVYDAIKSGFDKAVFIIREEFESEFKSHITDKFSDKITIEFAFQNITDLPDGFTCPIGREKPWGTGHAILSASELIDDPFLVINGDDFYGRESFKTVADYYRNGKNDFSMVAFQLDKTLSPFGSVTRGLCTTENNFLRTVIETEQITISDGKISSSSHIQLMGNEPVSMNMWGFTPILFDYLNEMIIDFLNKEGSKLKSEFLIPTVVNNLILSGKERVNVLHSTSKWFGVTYKEDKPFVMDEIGKLISSGMYPEKLF